jgi:hypothetical protein
MDLREKLKSYEGKVLMSILLGLGFATLFRQVCKGKNCVVFYAPKEKKIENKVFKHDNKCYKYSLETTNCNTKNKKKLNFA